MELQSLQDLYLEQLRDLHSAETQITQSLPKLVQAARHPELRQGFEKHLEQTREQLRRLERIGQSLGKTLAGHECKGMKGLLEEGNEMLRKKADSDVLDAALIAAAQRVEHYEIAGYTTARNLAQQLHQSAIVQLLTKTLGEEENAGQLLNQVAQPLMSVAKMPASVE